MLTLLVEDSVLIRGALARYLRRHGHEVLEAGTVREALAVLASSFLACCVVDLELPDGNGLSLLPSITTRSPATRTFIVSGYVTTPITVAAIKAGAYDVISKPVSPERLKLILEHTAATVPSIECHEGTLRDRYARIEREIIDQAMLDSGWNVSRAARLLGIHRQALQRKLRKTVAS